MRSRLLVAAGAALAAAATLCACGASTATSNRSSDDASSTSAPGPAIEIVRTGGIAGVRDTVMVQSDGSARVTTKEGRSRECRPPGRSLDRLRAIDLAALAAAPTSAPRVADGFHYSVRVGDERASVSEGDDDGRRADMLDAAAVVVTSCLGGQPGPVGY